MLRISRGMGFRTATCLMLAVVWAGGQAGCDDTNLQQGKSEIVVEPTQLDFGAQNVGDTVELALRVRNAGTLKSMVIDGLRIEGDSQFAIAAIDGTPFEANFSERGIAAGLDSVLTVSFGPSEQIAYTADLVIESDADNTEELRVALTGSGSVPDIHVDPPLLNFGGVRLNSSGSLSLTVSNQGEAPLRVELAALSLESGDPEAPFFWIGQDMDLLGDEQAGLEVVYAPKEIRLDGQGHVQPDSDTLLIASNDPDENPVRVELTGFVSDNLPPVTAVRITRVTKLDGSTLDDVCVPAPVDTIKFEGQVLDPEGGQIQGADLAWAVAVKPTGSTRSMAIPAVELERFSPSFKPDLSGDYVVCLAARDAEGNLGTYDPEAACDCAVANAAEDFSCPCMRLSAYPREDIRVELTWDILGPDLDLHLVAPDGDYCSPTRECRFDPFEPDNPAWTRTACVDTGAITTCRTPNCDPVATGCLAGQDCYDAGAGAGPECWWQTCSGTDCYWNARRPDWGLPGDTTDDPVLAIDCTGQCRAENINLNNPSPGIYTIMVNYYEFRGDTTARVRIYFKGDIAPTAEFQAEMTETCDRWNVALIEWIDHDNHPVTYLGDSHSLSCCD